MADESEKAPTTAPTGGPAPAFDPTEMRKMIAEGIQQHMATEDKDGAGGNDEVVRTRAPVATENPLKALIDPILEPHIRELTFLTNDAKDMSSFYSVHQDAGEFRTDIEQAFNHLAKQGTPMTREAVYDWYKGKNLEKFIERAQKAEQAKIDSAKQNTDGGPGFSPLNGNRGPVKDASLATDEELNKALEGATF